MTEADEQAIPLARSIVHEDHDLTPVFSSTWS
jgi:hypothetical protein